MTTARAYKKWVPKAAQEALDELFAMPELTAHQQTILDRLANDLTMKTDVWAKLPDDPPDQQGIIISWVLEVAHYASNICRPPMPKKKSEIPAWFHAYPPILTPASVSTRALMLKEGMIKTAADAGDYWSELWPGDPQISIDQAITLVDHIENFYQRLSAQHRALIKTADLPSSGRKKGAKNAPQIFFDKMMSQRLDALYGRPLDAVVFALTEVIFGPQSSKSGEETVRGRRRKTPPEHSRKKTA